MEGTNVNMATQVDASETRVRELTWHLESAEEENTLARTKLKFEWNHYLEVKRWFTKTLEEMVSNKVVEVVELTRIRAKEENERAVKVAVTEYLEFEAFQVMKVRCYLDGFEGF